MKKRLSAIVTGRVQMVMYRDFTRRKAAHLGIAGHVMNHDDGSVHVVAEGEEMVLQEFLASLNKGSLFAQVDEVHASWDAPINEFSLFEIRY